jgi:hypothetical protein
MKYEIKKKTMFNICERKANMEENMKPIIEEALKHPSNTISYRISQNLAQFIRKRHL